MVVRRGICKMASVVFGLVGASGPVLAAPPGFLQAQRAFDETFTIGQRVTMQILLIAAGYSNMVPVEHLSPKYFQGLKSFEADNGFTPNGRLNGPQVGRLFEVGNANLKRWGFQNVSYPGRALHIWAPMGLGLDRSETPSGLHFKDAGGRLVVHMLSLENMPARKLYEGILAEARKEGTKINYPFFEPNENWFVVSSTTGDGKDRYYRYHQDGTSLTGFALEWNKAAGDIDAVRIAIIMSGSLRAAMTGAPFVDPPNLAPEARAPAPVTPATVPVAPAPTPPPKSGFSSGTGFFVSEAGHFVTNAHVVKDCTDIAVKTDDGAISTADRVATDTTNDLALLKLPKKPARIVALRVGARLGEGVEAFGFPHTELLASAGNFTLGNISALSGLGDDSRYLQISAPVQAGNSGGPLLDTSGNLVGVVSMKLNAMKVAVDSNDLPQNVNFAIKSGTLANFLDANRVTYKVGAPAAVPLQPADIADAARAVSGFVVCK